MAWAGQYKKFKEREKKPFDMFYYIIYFEQVPTLFFVLFHQVRQIIQVFVLWTFRISKSSKRNS